MLTDEVIDWNCPKIEAFDPYFFLDHLRWQLETEDTSSLPQIRKWISSHPRGIESMMPVLEYMMGMGLINPDWTLVET